VLVAVVGALGAILTTVAADYERVYEKPKLRDLIHEVVQTIKRNLKVDWTEPHREDVKAAVRAAVKRVLRRNGVKDEDQAPILELVIQQAEALYAEWPAAA
jgi:type I restriction enzyme R subunit